MAGDEAGLPSAVFHAVPSQIVVPDSDVPTLDHVATVRGWSVAATESESGGARSEVSGIEFA